MIQMELLSKSFISEELETLALNEIDISVKPGEFISIVGPSGCGKTTLLNIIGLLDTPSLGVYKFCDKDVSGITEIKRAKLRKGNIGFIFQNFNLIESLSVYENVELPLKYQEVSISDRKERVNEVLERMGISHRAKHYPKQLSGGQQQRVAIARAVVTKPKLIVADEPTGNLDSKNGNEVMKMLTELNKEGITIVMVTHSQIYADMAQRKINLFDGKVAEDNTHL